MIDMKDLVWASAFTRALSDGTGGAAAWQCANLAVAELERESKRLDAVIAASLAQTPEFTSACGCNCCEACRGAR